MARTYSRLPINLCPKQLGARIRFRSPTLGSKPELAKIDTSSINKTGVKWCSDCELTKQNDDITRRKVMVVVDSSPEAMTALHWALSHALQSNDTLVLLDVIKPSPIVGEKSENSTSAEVNQRLHDMKSICQAKRPEVHVEVSLVEARERGPAIVEETKKYGISLLVVGHKKRPVTLQYLLMIWAVNRKSGADTAEYCVQNAPCMALAVRQKSRKGGGYLITTRRLKDFWLLA